MYVHTYINKQTSLIFNCVTPESVSLASLTRQIIIIIIMMIMMVMIIIIIIIITIIAGGMFQHQMLSELGFLI